MKRKHDIDEPLSENSRDIGAVHVVRNTRPCLRDTPSSSGSHSYVATPARVGRLPIHSSPSAGPAAALLARGVPGDSVPIEIRKRTLSLSSGSTKSSSSSATLSQSDDDSSIESSDSDSELESESSESVSDGLSVSTSAASTSSDSEDDSDSSSDESEISDSDEDSDASSEAVVTLIHRQSRTTRISLPNRIPLTQDDSEDDRMTDDVITGPMPGARTTVIERADGSTTLRMGSRPVISHSASSSSSLLLSRLRTFLPEMESANRVLEEERERGIIADRIMEVGEDEAGQCVEMNLGLGVLEPRSEEVITDKEQEMTDEPQEEDDDVMGRLLARPATTQAFVQEV